MISAPPAWRLCLPLVVALALVTTRSPLLMAQSVGPSGPVGNICGACGMQYFSGSHSCPYVPPHPVLPSPQVRPGDDSRRISVADPRRNPPVDPPSSQQRAQELSRRINDDGLAHMRREDYAGAMNCFSQALKQWAGNTEAHGNLMAAQKQLHEQLARAQAQREKEEKWRREVEEAGQSAIKGAAQQFGQDVARRKADEVSRKIQQTKARIDGILGRLSAEFEKAGGGGSGPSPSAPRIDFSSTTEVIAPPHLDPMVVDARHYTGSARVNPRTHVLLDAIQAGRGVWPITVGRLKGMTVANPSDTAARDAFHFVIGFTSGLNVCQPRFPADQQIYPLPDDSGPQIKREAEVHVSVALKALGEKDVVAAHRAFQSAHRADPKHEGVRDLMNWSEGMAGAKMVAQPDDASQGELAASLVEASQRTP